MLSGCFFLLVLGSPVRKTSGRLSSDCLAKKTKAFYDQLEFSIIQVFTHFLEFLKICPKMFPFFFFAKMRDIMSADSEKPNITGGIWKHHRGYLDEILHTGGAVANRLRRRTSDQTVLGSNPAAAAALSPWTRLFTPIVPRRSLHISFY